jgi:hypothetical protein
VVRGVDLAGACFSLGLIELDTLMLPIGLGVGRIVRLPAWPRGAAVPGVLAGVGVTVTWIGSIHFDYQECTSNQVSLSLPQVQPGRSATRAEGSTVPTG